MLWQGRKWLKLKIPAKDNIYYYEPGSIPFLSTYYPPQILMAVICNFLNLDMSFRVYQYYLNLHYLVNSLLSYALLLTWTDPLTALFGAISYSYCASSFKINTPSFVYTACWIPGIFLGGILGAVCLGMAILGGYWPVLIYFVPLVAWSMVGQKELILGVIIGLPQIIPTLFYYPRSIRTLKHNLKGTVPLWKFLDLFWGDRKWCFINGVAYTEMALFCGILTPIFALMSDSKAWIGLFVSFLLCLFWGPLRITARALTVFSFFLVWMAVSSFQGVPDKFKVVFILIQAWSLLKNADIYPHHPFCEPNKRPSFWFSKSPDINKFPYFTGYYHEIPTRGYTGGFSLKETCERNGITNPDGEALHG